MMQGREKTWNAVQSAFIGSARPRLLCFACFAVRCFALRFSALIWVPLHTQEGKQASEQPTAGDGTYPVRVDMTSTD